MSEDPASTDSLGKVDPSIQPSRTSNGERSNRRRGSQRRRSQKGEGLSVGRMLKWIFILGFAGLLILVVSLFGVKFWLENWLKGEGFRAKMEEKLAETLRSHVEISQPSWEGSQTFIQSLTTKGYEDAAVSRIDLSQVRLQFDGIAEGALLIPQVTVGRSVIEFSHERLPGTFPAASAASESPNGSGAQLPAWLRRWVPDRARMDSLRLDSLDFAIKNATGLETLGLRSTKVAMNPVDISDTNLGWQFVGQGGKLQIINQPPMTLESISLRWKNQDLRVQDAKVELLEGARLSAQGDITLGNSPAVDLALHIENLEPRHILGPDSVGKVSGQLNGDFDVTGIPGHSESFKSTGTMRLLNGVVENVPQLEQVATYTKSPRFKRLVLSEATADFVKQGDTLTIPKLRLQSDGLLRIEGTLTLQGPMIQGDLQVGLTPGTLGWIPGAERKVFNQSRDGFLWTTVKVSGTKDKFNEDLTNRLVSAAVESVVEETPGKAIDTAKELLKNPETTDKLINEGLKFLDGFLKK